MFLSLWNQICSQKEPALRSHANTLAIVLPNQNLKRYPPSCLLSAELRFLYSACSFVLVKGEEGERRGKGAWGKSTSAACLPTYLLISKKCQPTYSPIKNSLKGWRLGSERAFFDFQSSSFLSSFFCADCLREADRKEIENNGNVSIQNDHKMSYTWIIRTCKD